MPILVADLLEESARDFLLAVARANGTAWVPLVAAPMDTSRHLLEVYTVTSTLPIRLHADPVGPPSDQGFPLKLSVADVDSGDSLVEASMAEVAAYDHDLSPTEDEEGDAGGLQVAVEARREEPPTLPKQASTTRRTVPRPLSSEHAATLAGDARAREVSSDSLVGRAIAGGKLVIESLVGKGMMGAVYKALHRELRLHVAVKVMHGSYQHDVDFCQRFYAEALAASRLDHPNLVRVYDFGQEPDGLLYLAMEFVAGRSLRAALWEDGPMSSRRIAEIMMQVCAGLGQAHTRGIIHRDVKPDNVVLVKSHDDDGVPFEQAKVCDFGLALLRTNDATHERFAGTPVYMSPEQCRGDELDARTDVYACGVMLYELATGTVPFLSDKPIVVVNRHLTMPPPPLASVRSDVDPRLEEIVQKALRKSRDERYQSLLALRQDLKMLLRSLRPPPLARAATDSNTSLSNKRTSSVPPPRSSAPPPRRRSSYPPDRASRDEVVEESPSARRAAWLEDTQHTYSQFFLGMASGDRSEEIAESLARDPKAWLTKLVQERDARVTARMLAEVEGVARRLAQNGDARALRAVSSTVFSMATDETRVASLRSEAVATTCVFKDPTLLAPIAERLLAHDDEHRKAASKLLLDAGVAGAYALYGARVKAASSESVRAPFVETMRAIGGAAWPIVRAALERIPAAALTGGHPVGRDLAEDLLSCVPTVRDDAAGHLIAKYVYATEPLLCSAATRALGRLWAERALPLFFALLEADDDGVQRAAIQGIKEVGAVDVHVVRRLAPLLTGKGLASADTRFEAVVALESVTRDARALAVRILVHLVRDANLDDVLALAASRALFSLMGNEARAVLIGRCDLAKEPLKSQLLLLLRDPPLPDVNPRDVEDFL